MACSSNGDGEANIVHHIQHKCSPLQLLTSKPVEQQDNSPLATIFQLPLSSSAEAVIIIKLMRNSGNQLILEYGGTKTQFTNLVSEERRLNQIFTVGYFFCFLFDAGDVTILIQQYHMRHQGNKI